MYVEKKMYERTGKLTGARFRGQRSLVVEALAQCTGPVGLDAIASLADKNGQYCSLLNQWARENGGVKGSIRYHLRALARLGMVREIMGTTPIRTQVVGWGNSQAVRIPRELLERVQLCEGDEVEIKAENGRIAIEPVNRKDTLESLVAGITPKNRHKEMDWGAPVGNEVW
jgi:antitoxin MazE